MEFTKLFEPIVINGKLEVKNRIVLPALGLDYTRHYNFNERFQGFYRARAHGGVGLMTVGPLAIDKVGSAPSMPQLFDDTNVEPLRDFIEEVHRDTDVKVGTQLFHMGRYSYSFLWGEKPIAPSAIPSKLTKHTPREMTHADIEGTQRDFVEAAARAREAGFDYIEIIACTGYLVSEFLSPVTNQRTDEYGGSLENRMRFGVEMIEKMRKALGDDIALGIRIAGNDFMEGGNSNTENSEFAAAAEKAGIDAVNVTGGWHETPIPQLTTDVPPGVYTYLARGVKDRVGIPVFASNRLGDPYLAERTLRSGAADMICWARPIIADPELPNKVKEGRFDEIITCIACNQGCFDAVFSQKPVRCVLNPTAGRENEFDLRKAETRKRVVVAGGGPAGMEFAVTAAQRGHAVTLYEKEDRLGGQINLACAPPGKAEFHNMVKSLTHRTTRKVWLSQEGNVKSAPHFDPTYGEYSDDELAQMQADVIANPRVYGLLVSPDLRSALIRGTLNEGALDYERVFEQLLELRAAETVPGVRVHATGNPVLVGWVSTYVDQIVQIFLYTILIMLALLTLYFRRTYGILLPTIGLVLTSIWGLGILSLLGYNLDPLMMVIPFLISARAMSHGIQLVENPARGHALPVDSRPQIRVFHDLFGQVSVPREA